MKRRAYVTRWRQFQLAGFRVAKNESGWFWCWSAGPLEWRKVHSTREGRPFATRREAMAGCMRSWRQSFRRNAW